MRLIDIEAPYKVEIELDGEKCHATVTAPTVDAVPVVRCGECKHRKEKTFWCEKVQDFISNPEWFCADGERKEGTMERLTYWCDDGMGGGEYRANENGSEYSGPSIDRLAAYEDTGLEPEDINDFVDSYKTMRDNEEARVRLMCGTGAIHPERAAEITKAEAEGRLLVLPCKVGEKFYYNFLGKTYEGKLTKVVYHEAGVQVYFADYDGDNASRRLNEVFKTREEAEAALKEREGT